MGGAMRRLGILLLVTVAQLVSAAQSAAATAPKPGIYFVKYLGGLERYIPIKTASLGDKNFGIIFVQTPVKEGKHVLSFTVYDGAGREVRKSDATLEAKNGTIMFASVGTFDREKDSIGTWTWVAELDGQPQFTESIYVGI